MKKLGINLGKLLRCAIVLLLVAEPISGLSVLATETGGTSNLEQVAPAESPDTEAEVAQSSDDSTESTTVVTSESSRLRSVNFTSPISSENDQSEAVVVKQFDLTSTKHLMDLLQQELTELPVAAELTLNFSKEIASGESFVLSLSEDVLPPQEVNDLVVDGRLVAEVTYQADYHALVFTAVESLVTGTDYRYTTPLAINPSLLAEPSVVELNFAIANTILTAKLFINNQKIERKGQFYLTKINQDGQPLEGVTFDLLTETEELVVQGVTDQEGKVQFSDLAKGTYILQESVPLEGYARVDTRWTVTVNDAGHVLLTNQDKVTTLKAKVEKIKQELDSITNTVTLSGELTLPDKSQTGDRIVLEIDKGLDLSKADVPNLLNDAGQVLAFAQVDADKSQVIYEVTGIGAGQKVKTSFNLSRLALNPTLLLKAGKVTLTHNLAGQDMTAKLSVPNLLPEELGLVQVGSDAIESTVTLAGLVDGNKIKPTASTTIVLSGDNNPDLFNSLNTKIKVYEVDRSKLKGTERLTALSKKDKEAIKDVTKDVTITYDQIDFPKVKLTFTKEQLTKKMYLLVAEVKVLDFDENKDEVYYLYDETQSDNAVSAIAHVDKTEQSLINMTIVNRLSDDESSDAMLRSNSVSTDSTGQLTITKIQSDTKAKLPGAVFTLYEGNYDQYKQGALSGLDVYRDDITTGSNGVVKLTGLSAGIYQLVEKHAPKGYSRSSDTWTVKVLSSGGTLIYLNRDEETATTEARNLNTSVIVSEYNQKVSGKSNSDTTIYLNKAEWLEQSYKIAIKPGTTPHSGDYFTVKFDDEVWPQGVASEYTPSDILHASTGEVLAVATYDQATKTITYTFTSNIEAYDASQIVIPLKQYFAIDRQVIDGVTDRNVNRSVVNQNNAVESATITNTIAGQIQPGKTYTVDFRLDKTKTLWYQNYGSYGADYDLGFTSLFASHNYREKTIEILYYVNAEKDYYPNRSVKLDISGNSNIQKSRSTVEVYKVNSNYVLPPSFGLDYSRLTKVNPNVVNTTGGTVVTFDPRTTPLSNNAYVVRYVVPIKDNQAEVSVKGEFDFYTASSWGIPTWTKIGVISNTNSASQVQPEVDLPVKYASVTIPNEKKTAPSPGAGRLELKKVDDKGSPLANAQFGLYTGSYETLTDASQPVYTGRSTTSGELSFSDLKPGIYTLKEIVAPDGYTKTKNTWTVTVQESGVTMIKMNPRPNAPSDTHQPTDVSSKVIVRDHYFNVEKDTTKTRRIIYPNRSEFFYTGFTLAFKKGIKEGDYFTLEYDDDIRQEGTEASYSAYDLVIDQGVLAVGSYDPKTKHVTFTFTDLIEAVDNPTVSYQEPVNVDRYLVYNNAKVNITNKIAGQTFNYGDFTVAYEPYLNPDRHRVVVNGYHSGSSFINILDHANRVLTHTGYLTAPAGTSYHDVVIRGEDLTINVNNTDVDVYTYRGTPPQSYGIDWNSSQLTKVTPTNFYIRNGSIFLRLPGGYYDTEYIIRVRNRFDVNKVGSVGFTTSVTSYRGSNYVTTDFNTWAVIRKGTVNGDADLKSANVTIVNRRKDPMKLKIAKLDEANQLIKSGHLSLKLETADKKAVAINDSDKVLNFDLQTQSSGSLIATLPEYLNGTYILTETSSPRGYVLSTHRFYLTIDRSLRTIKLIRVTDSSGDEVTYEDRQHQILTSKKPIVLYSEATTNEQTTITSIDLDIVNKKPVYPKTGGIGSAVWYITGVSLMSLALYHIKRRKEDTQHLV